MSPAPGERSSLAARIKAATENASTRHSAAPDDPTIQVARPHLTGPSSIAPPHRPGQALAHPGPMSTGPAAAAAHAPMPAPVQAPQTAPMPSPAQAPQAAPMPAAPHHAAHAHHAHHAHHTGHAHHAHHAGWYGAPLTGQPANNQGVMSPLRTRLGDRWRALLARARRGRGPSADERSRWAIFEQLGLGPDKKLSEKSARLLVSAYRILGFSILTIIVVVLVGYLATTAFYFVSDSWIQPMVVSRSDPKVLEVMSQVTEQQNARDRIAAELSHMDRYIDSQQRFQGEFAAAIRADLSGRKVALDRLRELASDYAGARARIESSNRAFASASRKRMAQEYRAGLIDRDDMLSGKYQLAQITSSNLSLAERQVEYETRAAELEAEARALDAIVSENGGDNALSYDVLRIKQEYELSRLETAKAIEQREALRASLARQEQILTGLEQSPYIRALAQDASVAFVPYGNLDNVAVGSPVYACALEMIFCGQVGKVLEILPGEVSFDHPHREKILRGKMVSIELEEGDAAEDDVLFVGGRPLLI